MSLERVDAVLAELLAPGADEAPAGAVLGVVHGGGRVVAARGASRGRDGDPDREPMTPRTQHDLASVTKVVATTTMIMRLVDAGRLALDDPLGDHLDGLPRDGWTAMTVRHLLAHRAGLWEWWPLYALASDRVGGLAAIRGLPLRYPVDAGRHYSDLGFLLLGEVVESVTGLGLAEAFRELVADPLRLSETGYARPARPDGDVAAGARGDEIERGMVASGRPYPVPVATWDVRVWRTVELRGEVSDGNSFHVFGGIAGHAGLFSTADELLRVAGALAGGELVSAATAREFFRDGPDAGQALGFRSYRLAGRRLVGHTGFSGTAVVFDPESDLALVLLTNRLHRTRAPRSTDELLRSAAAALPDPKESPR